MASNLCYAFTDTPTPGHAWSQLSDTERCALVENTVARKMAFSTNILKIVEAKSDGQVIVKLLEPVPADQRGTLLLDLEAFLKESIDQGLVVWLEPFGDRSTLRNLRGIEVKS
jgi:hypothetical protein